MNQKESHGVVRRHKMMVVVLCTSLMPFIPALMITMVGENSYSWLDDQHEEAFSHS